MEEHSIPVENILGHEDISPGRKIDPGKLFDWDRVRDALTKKSVVIEEPLEIKADPVEEEDDSNFSMGSGTDGYADQERARKSLNEPAGSELFLKIVDFLKRVFEVLVKNK